MPIFILLILLLIPGLIEAAAIPHGSASQLTEQSTTSSSYVDISGASIADTAFVDGETYFVHVSAQVSENGTLTGGIRTLHGTTAFADSEHIYSRSSTDKDYTTYEWWACDWVAPAGEGIKVQLKSANATAYATNIEIKYMQLSGSLTAGTDYVCAERTTDDALSTTPTDGASITFTPGTASQTWLVKTLSQINAGGNSAHTSRLIRSGEASSSTPQAVLAPVGSSEQWLLALTRAFTLGAVSNTFTEQSESVSTNTRLNSKIFALNLHKFAARAVSYTEAVGSLSTTFYATNREAMSITPTVLGDVWIETGFIHDKISSSGEVNFRIQVDGADAPAGQTAAQLSFDSANTTITSNDIPMSLATLAAGLSASSHAITLDLSTGNGADVKQSSLSAWTMELASVSPPSTRRRSTPMVLP